MEDYHDDTTKDGLFCKKCKGFMVEDFSGDGGIWSYCQDCGWSADDDQEK